MYLNIHNKLNISLQSPPTGVEKWFRDELPLFITAERPPRSDILVSFTNISLPPKAVFVSSTVAVDGQDTYLFDGNKSLVRFAFENLDSEQFIIEADQKINQRFFTQSLEPFLHVLASKRNTLFIHSSAVKYQHKGVLFSAWAHTGKSNLVLGLLQAGAGYIADDWTIVDADKLYAYPKSLNLFNYNFKHYHKLRAKAPNTLRALFGINKALLGILTPLKRGNSTISHYAREVSQVLDAKGHVRIPLTKAFPQNTIVQNTELNNLFLLQRYNGSTVEFESIPPKTYATVMSDCLEYERRDLFSWFQMSRFINPTIASQTITKSKERDAELLEKIAEKHPPTIVRLPDSGVMSETVLAVIKYVETNA